MAATRRFSRIWTTSTTYGPTANTILCQSKLPFNNNPRLYSRADTSICHRTDTHVGWLFVDSVFPIQIARWDIRHYIGIFRQEYLLAALKARLESVKTHGFSVLSLESHQKDGGVFVQFSYNANDPKGALEMIEAQLAEEAQKHGGLPSWLRLRSGRFWLVKGAPWKEDMNRFASSMVKVAFDGPDIPEQLLYQLFRPYGRIQDLTHPIPVPAGALRSSIVTFDHLRSATIARNATHGLRFSRTDNESTTLLRIAYQRPIQAHAVRDWMSSHPKIVFPVLLFLFGTLTYTIFDPIRSLMVQGKMLDWFNFREFKLYKWLLTNTFDRLSITSSMTPGVDISSTEEVWRERDEAIGVMKTYLRELPTTVAFVHGPQGSGKTRMLETVLKETGRRALIIDCRNLQKATSDAQIVAALADQTGYWPVFTFLNSMNNLIDLASVGLIGQKAGLSSSLSDQLQQILAVVGTALKRVSLLQRAAIRDQIKSSESEQAKEDAAAQIREKIRRGTWHDGRLDCIAGNGVMSELGIGDEPMVDDAAPTGVYIDGSTKRLKDGEVARKQKTKEEMEAVGTLPVVVIRNYTAKMGSSREELLTVLAQWAGMLSETQIAHVIVISDNRENSKFLSKALPSKSLISITLSDADPRSSVSFVEQKLRDADIQIELTPERAAYIERLGGRASDLESLIHKVRNGQHIEEAVEDIINRGVGELRKNAFGDENDEAKNLPWSREQAWRVLSLLSEHGEVPYYYVLAEFPFKGDEMSLRNMEHAELISIGTHDGRPSTIRPGKPVFRWVFKRLVHDPIFQATQDIALNEKLISSSEKTILACEQELITLRGIKRSWWAMNTREKYLSDKLLKCSKKIEVLEEENAELKKVLEKGESGA